MKIAKKIANWAIKILGGHTADELKKFQLEVDLKAELFTRLLQEAKAEINYLNHQLSLPPLQQPIQVVDFKGNKIVYTYNLREGFTIEQLKKHVGPIILNEIWKYAEITERQLPHTTEVEFIFYMGKKNEK